MANSDWILGYEAGFKVGLKKDDPEMDCTDAAHPAWWRGYEHGSASCINEVNRILDGDTSLQGACNEPWQSLRLRLFDIREMLGIAEYIIRTIQSSRVPKMCKTRIMEWFATRAAYNLRTQKKE